MFIQKNLYEAKHEETDSKIVLHCTKSHCSDIVFSSSNTDVLVLLLAHFNSINCDKVWIKAGISKRHKLYLYLHSHWEL